MSSKTAIIKYDGKIYRIPKVPFEFDEQACERGWYIINKQLSINTLTDVQVALSKSIIHLNEKKLQMKYYLL